jgi:hypothetical protein
VAKIFVFKEVESIASQMVERVSIVHNLVCKGIYLGWIVYTAIVGVEGFVSFLFERACKPIETLQGTTLIISLSSTF